MMQHTHSNSDRVQNLDFVSNQENNANSKKVARHRFIFISLLIVTRQQTNKNITEDYNKEKLTITKFYKRYKDSQVVLRIKGNPNELVVYHCVRDRWQHLKVSIKIDVPIPMPDS